MDFPERIRDLPFDPLLGLLQLRFLDDATFIVEDWPAEAHRHDYHELIWTRSGSAEHEVDGVSSSVEAGTITFIGRGQVHRVRLARAASGVGLRFRPELLHGDATSPPWLLGKRGALNINVPQGELERLEALLDALAAETRTPPDGCSTDLERHLLSALLLLVARWHEATRIEPSRDNHADHELYRRFVELLERDFARHHDALHYADELRVPQAALSSTLARVSGRTTKQLIVERRMLEASRLLLFTDLHAGEIAHRAGFTDPLYFSRAFKRHYGEPPLAYRERARQPQTLNV